MVGLVNIILCSEVIRAKVGHSMGRLTPDRPPSSAQSPPVSSTIDPPTVQNLHNRPRKIHLDLSPDDPVELSVAEDPWTVLPDAFDKLIDAGTHFGVSLEESGAVLKKLSDLLKLPPRTPDTVLK